MIMNDKKNLNYFFLGFAIASLLAIILISHGNRDNQPSHNDTVTVTTHDTIKIDTPTPTQSVIIRRDTVSLPVVIHDTIRHDMPSACAGDMPFVDSTLVEIPITQRIYEGDGYRAWVSGYRPSLDSLWMEHTKVTQSITTSLKPRRWGVSISAGAAITTHGLEPYIGIGISCNLVTFKRL